MLKIHGLSDGGPEEDAAEQLANLASMYIPNLDDDRLVSLEIFPSVQCFGQRVKDIDLLVLYQDRRKPDQTPSSNGRPFVQSFCATIEVKDHSPENIKFEGPSCFVRYRERWSSATTQSEGQKTSVFRYASDHLPRSKPPFVINLIWLRNSPSSRLPRSKNNILGSDITWEDLISKIADLSGRPASNTVTVFSQKSYFDEVASIFGKNIEPTKIDRIRLEAITKKVLDRSKQQYAAKLGEQLLIFRGLGGTGKTVRLIQIAFQLYRERGMRCLILTYNKSLVADIKRLLAIQKISDGIGEKSISIRTVHSFMYKWLVNLDVIERGSDEFLESYEENLKFTVELIRSGGVEKEDLEMAVAQNAGTLDWDVVLVDEGQDWPQTERDLIFELYGRERTIVADGINQFVRGARMIDWQSGTSKDKFQIVHLRKSLRLKPNLCQLVNSFANELGLDEWKLDPETHTHGGRIILITGDPLSKKFHQRLSATARDDGNQPVDLLYCVPPSWVVNNRGDNQQESGGRISTVGMKYQEWGWKFWDATNLSERDSFPTDSQEYRIVQYDSCRGLEGWFVVNFAFDEFYNHKLQKATFSEEEKSQLFFDAEDASRAYANRWAMIPLTRAIDTLVLHISNKDSFIGEALFRLLKKHPDTIEHHHFD